MQGELVVIRANDPHPALPILDGPGIARAMVWPGMGSRWRTMHHLRLEPGVSTVELRHDGEAVYFVLAGDVLVVDVDAGREYPARAGAAIHAGPGTGHRIRAVDGPAELVGGPCPPDPALYEGISS